MPPAYATVEDFEAYVEGWTITDDEAALERLIERAERDVDSIVGDWAHEPNGLKFGDPGGDNPKGLDAAQVAALSRATCAQALYRWTMGEKFMVQSQHESVSGPDFTVRGTLPRVGPKVTEELAGTGLLRVWRTVRPDAA